MALRVLFIAALAIFVWALAGHVRGRSVPSVESAEAYLPRGVFHVSVNAREHGLTALNDLTARARGIGLQFVVLTDRDSQLAAPLVRDGVVALSYAETVTQHGSIVALGAPYAIEDKQKSDPLSAARGIGGLPVILGAWSGDLAGAGGVQIASAPAVARRLAGVSSFGLFPLVVGAQWNPRLAAAQLYARDDEALALWDAIPGHAVGICGAGTSGALDATRDLTTWQVVLDAPVSEPKALLDALTRGAFYCSAAMFGEGIAFEFGARSGNAWLAREGDTVRDGDAQEIVVVGPKSDVTHLVLFHDGVVVAETRGRELHYSGPTLGAYRAEVRIPIPGLAVGEDDVPIVYSNRIRVVEALPPRGWVRPADGPWAAP